MKTWIAFFVILFGAAMFARNYYSPSTPAEKAEAGNLPTPLKKDLGRVLNIAPSDLIAVATGSDAGGCSWDESKTEETKIYRRMVEKLLRMSAYEMGPDAPKLCEKAYFVDTSINSYTFSIGRLTVPPSHQYPPPLPDASTEYFRVEFAKTGEEKPTVFCLEKTDLESAVTKIVEEPVLADCEI